MTAPAQMVVDIEDIGVLNKVKNALKLMQGIGKITIHKQRMTGLERAHEDVRNGRIKRFKNKEDLYKDLGL